MENQFSQPAADTPRQQFHTRRIVFITLVILSVVGIGVMDYSEKFALWYWLSMAPIFAGASLALTWKTAHQKDATAAQHIRRQLFHWLVLVVALLLVFLMQRFGTLQPATSGLMALLMLAVTCLLAGVHFEWRMAVLGGILTLTFVAGVFVESFFWVLLIVAIVGIFLLVRGRGYDKV
jgi:hypothetical protein